MNDSLLRRVCRSPAVWPLAGILLLLAANLALKPAFARITILDGHLYGLPIDVLNHGAKILFVALGMTVVIATGGIDLSVGSIVAIAGATAAMIASHGVTSLPLIVGGALASGLAAGAINGLLVARLGVQPIVATLILMVSGRGIAQVLTDGQVLVIRQPGFDFLGNGFLLGLPFPAVLAMAAYAVAWTIRRRSAAALMIEAVGDNPAAARFAGLATDKIRVAAYVVSGLLAAVAGVMMAANIGAADSQRAGENLELDAIFAVVVGGTALEGGRFFLAGSFLGALLLQMLTTTLYNLGVPPAVAPVPKALLILAVCLAQSDRTRAWLSQLWRRSP
ncbi:MAG TPA: ABC transporter permease [Candidatus Didemnitutus sp.]|nr:ABC transporter permease [Candidatus Didemnitutus sp.]